MSTDLPIPGTSKPQLWRVGSEETITSPDSLRLLSRSPHPYHLRRPDPYDKASLEQSEQDANYLPSPSPTPSPYDTGDENNSGPRDAARGPRLARAMSDSGTEADDEGLSLLRGLPAPPLRPRKGLRGSRTPLTGGTPSPLVTPAYLSDVGRRFSGEFGRSQAVKTDVDGKESLEAQRKADSRKRRRKAELRRRVIETLLLVLLGGAVLRKSDVRLAGRNGHREALYIYFAVYCTLLLLYPLRLLSHRILHSAATAPTKHTARWLRIPSVFDPAPLLYPIFLPVYVALTLLPSSPKILHPNIALGLATLPRVLIPRESRSGLSYSTFHWGITMLPAIVSAALAQRSSSFLEDTSWRSLSILARDHDALTFLYPLHQALLPVLHGLTTTSLLPAELELLSVTLINILLHSSTAQMVIMKALLWGGGVGTMLLCGQVLRWIVTLARIPSWRFRPAVLKTRPVNGRVKSTNPWKNNFAATFGVPTAPYTRKSDADEDGPPGVGRHEAYRGRGDFARTIPAESSQHHDETSRVVLQRTETAQVLSTTSKMDAVSGLHSSHRRHTFSTQSEAHNVGKLPDEPARDGRKHRSKSIIQSYLSLTQAQARHRAVLYAGYVYSTIIALALFLIRPYTSYYALDSREPIGWALSYLFGDLSTFRLYVTSYNLNSWIPLPPSLGSMPPPPSALGRIPTLRLYHLGTCTTRLILISHFSLTLILALILLSLLPPPPRIELDTRRKIFHVTIVLILLPTIFIDPTFCSLALILALSLFLLLDVFRASQLPPLARPLAGFLQPYVDGRDLRGPVVVSHIFLLIGCAAPLWLALAGIDRTAHGAGWLTTPDWELCPHASDLSMVSGVICVGMGDAAASLVGRRHGRRKWPWSGGKSIEGSTAFVVAVVVGLLASKVWLIVGGWQDPIAITAWASVLAKTVVAAAGASLTEAVLTGGNDNVVVPVVLWLLVTGLRI